VPSSADDYRYPNESPEIRACSLPPDLVEKCRNLAATARLPFAGIDLRRTAEGDWFCFEVNPSPGFVYYEEATGQPIARSVARFLADASSGAADHQPALAGSA
jgi:glutathione synthase/RimK-type ligase-like ATP-grasp enzyme